MNETPRVASSRRELLKETRRVAAATALAAATVPHVYAAENNTIQVALIGSGGRGSGATANALSAESGPIKLVAMAAVFEHKLANSYQTRFALACTCLMASSEGGRRDVQDETRFHPC